MQGVEGQPLDASGTSGFLCKCSDGFGGYGCDKEVPHISTTVSGKGIFEQKGLEVVEEQWQYFQIEVCVCVKMHVMCDGSIASIHPTAVQSVHCCDSSTHKHTSKSMHNTLVGAQPKH